MSRLPSLPEPPHLSDVLARFPRGVMPLMEFHDEVLRGVSGLSVAEREMIAAYTSGVNACNFCHGVHRMVAEMHSLDPDMFEKVFEDPVEAGLDPKWVPLLAYLRKLTLTPSFLTDADAAAVLAAGWDEDAFYDAILVCSTFNMMNRIVEGCGVVLTAEAAQASEERHERLQESATPYQDFGKMVAEARVK